MYLEFSALVPRYLPEPYVQAMNTCHLSAIAARLGRSVAPVLAPALDTSRIQVIGDESERLKNYVVTRWGEASEAAKKQAS